MPDLEKILDEVQMWLATHGVIDGVVFSEAALNERITNAREAAKLQTPVHN